MPQERPWTSPLPALVAAKSDLDPEPEAVATIRISGDMTRIIQSIIARCYNGGIARGNAIDIARGVGPRCMTGQRRLVSTVGAAVNHDTEICHVRQTPGGRYYDSQSGVSDA